MFSIGDVVCYPMHGVGVIEAIEDRNVLGSQASYYILRFVSNKMTAMIPVDTAEKIGLRPIIKPEECAKVVDYFLSCEPDKGSNNWNQRYRDNLDKLKCGDIYRIADVVKCLKARDNEKGLSAGERKMLLTAISILTTELSVASGKNAEEFEKLIV